jgi:hypothetical protein
MQLDQLKREFEGKRQSSRSMISQKRRVVQQHSQKTLESPTKLNDSPTIPHYASISQPAQGNIAPFEKSGSTVNESDAATSEAPVDSKRAKQEAMKARLAALKANQN